MKALCNCDAGCSNWHIQPNYATCRQEYKPSSCAAMRRTFTTLMLVMVVGVLWAQQVRTFPTQNALWTEMHYTPEPYELGNNRIFHSFALRSGDTLIGSKTYHKLYHSFDTSHSSSTLCGALREENRKVYYYSINPITFPKPTHATMTIAANTEVLLYDFNLRLGDTVRASDGYRFLGGTSELFVASADSMLVGLQYKKRYTFGVPAYGGGITPMDWAVWVEGVGHLRGLLYPTGPRPANALWNDLMCHRSGGEWLYHHAQYTNCAVQNSFTGVEGNTPASPSLLVYPNPASGSISVDFEGTTYTELLLSDMQGRVVGRYNPRGRQNITIDVVGLPAGLYFVTLRSDSGAQSSARVVLK